ncbi:MAG: hypothetical protein CL504_09575 [Actinobacteria bacterium]|nr:hypothetical protein [Actinomycetota bacterium]
MANTFKNAFAADVNHAAYVDLYTAPSSTTTVILGLAICNKTATAVDATVQIQDTSASNADFQVLDTVSIPARTTLEVLAGQKYILETTDVLRVKSGTASALDVSLGIMEIT